MFTPPNHLAIGPVQCAWGAYVGAERAEPLVRPWIAKQLGIAPSTLLLTRDAQGRPRLGDGQSRRDASWSHSGSTLLVAVADSVDVGADLERLRPRPRALALASRFFTPAESAALAAIDGDEAQQQAFVRLWCAKEAVLKAHGRGLVFGLHKLEFTLTGDAWALRACDPELGAPEDWTLHAFSPLPGHVAALAWRARKTQT